MSPFDFVVLTGSVPQALHARAAERLRLADLAEITPGNVVVARRLVEAFMAGERRHKLALFGKLAPSSLRTAAWTTRKPAAPRGGDVAAQGSGCPRCGSPLRSVTLAGGLTAAFCPVDRVTVPV
jgi:hypothetical protein